jgi:hypothetical protein
VVSCESSQFHNHHLEYREIIHRSIWRRNALGAKLEKTVFYLAVLHPASYHTFNVVPQQPYYLSVVKNALPSSIDCLIHIFMYIISS